MGAWVHDISHELARHATKTYGVRPQTNGAAIHHSAGWGSPSAIARWHVDGQGWPGIGYHGVIFHGVAYQTQPLDVESYHVWKHNPYRLGFCFVGNYDEKHPKEEDLKVGARFVAAVLRAYGIEDVRRMVGPYFGRAPAVAPHKGLRWSSKKRDAYGDPKKTCPGDLFPWGRFVSAVEGHVLAKTDDLASSGITFPAGVLE